MPANPLWERIGIRERGHWLAIPFWQALDDLARRWRWYRERGARIIRLYYGMDGYPTGRSLAEIGRIYHLSGERIRCIMGKALRYMRHPDRKRLFTDIGDYDGYDELDRMPRVGPWIE